MTGRRLICACLLACASAASAADKPVPPGNVDLQWGVKIPLRDKVKLNATLYRARGLDKAQPCVFTLTPYIGQSYHDRGTYFATHGYVFLTVDARGRGNSEGNFRPLIQEAKDAHDVVEWLAKQSYCTDKVSMWGGSYAGYDQWAAAKEFPPHLASIVPVASPYAGIDFPMGRNIFYSYDMQWLTLTSGRASQAAIFGDQALWSSAFREMYLNHRPFRELDRITGNPSATFQEWLQHPAVDAYWDAYNPTRAQYAKLDLPILTITGQYDGDQPGALEHYALHMANASAAARARHYLIIGPWDHAGTRTPQLEIGGLKFNAASQLDLNDLHRQWYDWTLKSGAKPEFLKDAVAYYVAGAEQWRYAGSLAAVTGESRPWYLDSSGGRANDAFASGSLGASAATGAEPDRYVSDPLDTRAAEFTEDTGIGDYVDQRPVLADHGDQLIYHSAPLNEPLELAGFFKLSAWIAIDQPDTDIQVQVYEIKPDGSSVFLSGDQMRARYREDARVAKPVPAGVALRYDFDRFRFMARRLDKGSRLRLTVGAINTPYLEKNYNSGGVVADETAKDARTVHVTLLHDAEHPSALVLPVAAK